MNRSGNRIAAGGNCSQKSDGIPTDSRRSDLPVERCHNSGDQGIRSVDAGSLSLLVTLKIETRKPVRILLVEDDLDLAQFIRKGLKEEQYAVDFAADGEEGLALATGNPYDLLILDIMLPKLDGLTLCRRVRAKGNVTPVLLLTARNTVEAKVSGFDTGADQFLPKPFAFAELHGTRRGVYAGGAGIGRMKSLRRLIRQSVLMLMAGLLLVFSVLMYVAGDALLRRFVDGRLLGLAETLAKIVEQHPNIIE